MVTNLTIWWGNLDLFCLNKLVDYIYSSFKFKENFWAEYWVPIHPLTSIPQTTLSPIINVLH